MPRSLGEKLRALRGNMSLREAAQKTGLSHTYINQLENGIDPRSGKEIFPSLPVLEQIANGYRIPREELLILVGYLKPRDGSIESEKDKSPIDLLNRRDTINTRDEVNAPIVAEIACGEPMFTEDAILGTFPVSSLFVNVNDGPYVWVKAKGESMINVRIFDGSLVLIRIQSHVDSGDIAAVCIDAETATLKRVYFLADGIMLQPENSTMTPVTYEPERIRIVGKAITVVSDIT